LDFIFSGLPKNGFCHKGKYAAFEGKHFQKMRDVLVSQNCVSFFAVLYFSLFANIVDFFKPDQRGE
jgi:hypothetical protein